MKTYTIGKLLLSAAIIPCVGVASIAQAQDIAPMAPPEVVRRAPPAPPAPPPAPPRIIPPVPEAQPAPVLTDKGAIKQAKRARQADAVSCLNGPATPAVAFTKLQACDRELAFTNRDSDRFDRRAQLLHRRAYYLLALGENSAALQFADASDAIGKDDFLFVGATGIGNGILRAAALTELNRKPEALAEIDRLRAIRPYSGVIGQRLDRMATNSERDIEKRLATMAAKIKWQPDSLRSLVPLYIWRGKFAEASQIIDQVSLIDPKPRAGWTMSSGFGQGSPFSQNINFEMEKAYIWGGLNQTDKSAAIIADARKEIVEFVGAEPVGKKGEKPRKRDIRNYESRKIEGARLSNSVGEWETAIALRPKLAAMSAKDADMAVTELKSIGIASLEMRRNVPKKPKVEGQKDAIDSAFIDELLTNELMRVSPQALDEMLPDAEYLDTIPNFGNGAFSNLMFGGDNGYSQTKENDPTHDYRTIRFATTSGSSATADELSLAAVAQYAETDGYDSFIMLARRLVKRQTSYGYGGASFDSGYETQLRVVMLKSNNLAPEWAAKKHRLVMVQEIKDNLLPRYATISALKSANKK